MAILLASWLPALHSLSHDTSYADDDISSVYYSTMEAKAGCDMCSFHFSISSVPEFYSYTLHIPFKEEVYIVSLEDKVNTSPFQLFRLRAPPAFIG